MSMRAMWITGCRSTVESVFMMRTGEANSEARIYQYGGSHGCINLPPAKAKILYDLVYTGIPVICYN